MNNRSFDEFTNLYPVQKTLRFELKPIGKTKDWIEEKGLLEQDEHRSESYKVVKKIIDFYHKHFIDKSLMSMPDDEKEQFNQLLAAYRELAKKNDPTLKKKLEKVQDNLRKIIKGRFETKRLLGKELIKEDLMSYLYECEVDGVELPEKLSIDECKSVVSEFKDFTTYFTGFSENRKNMYSEEAKSTSIAYRLIHENLPKFIANMNAWDKVKETLKDSVSQLDKDMAHYMGGITISQMFEDLSSFSQCITQAGITRYNTIIGGISEGDIKVKGLNEYINLYNQTCKEKKDRLPKMTELFKMILSDKGTLSWIPERFENDAKLLETVNKLYQEIQKDVFVGDTDHISLKDLMANLSDYDLRGIYIKNDTVLTTVMKQAYDDWSVMAKAMEAAYDSAYPLKDKRKLDQHEEKRTKWIKSFDSFSLEDICHHTKRIDIIEWYENLWCEDDVTIFEKVEAAYTEVETLLNTDYRGNLRTDSRSIEKLKTFLDTLKDLQRLGNTLKGNGDESGRDGRFYAEWERLMDVLNQITPLYNMVRNYVTQKAYSEEKFKLNFENPALLSGWPNPQNTSGVLFAKNDLYYLGILPNGSRLSADAFLRMKPNNENDKISFVRYLQGGDMGKNVQNLMVIDGKTVKKNGRKNDNGVNELLEKLKCTYLPEEINRIRKNGEYSKNSPAFKKSSLTAFIDYYKQLVKEYYTDYNFSFKESSEYDNFADFTDHINEQSYSLTFVDVSNSSISQLVEDGKLYLFQIYNKDFSTYSKGTPNIHTLYWRALFSVENLSDVVYKLNGQAEVFYRKHSIEYDEKHWKEGHHYDELKNKFAYPIIKDRRYALDKFQFHVPITMNFKATGGDYINQQVREFIKAGGVEHIIGIDRGERHLLYLSMIDLDGNIVKQFTLNNIKNDFKETDYHSILDKKEEDRLKARQNWQTIEGIKDLKNGYLSQVVHIISQLMVEYKAIVILEDLNFGFMRGRQKVEKQVYQKFEKALIDKLNYLVDKKKPTDQTGGLLHALQLTSKFESFLKMGKQSGFLFYVPASLTSKIDPVTGFANYINTKYESVEKSRELFGKFADIRYNDKNDYFEFVIDDYKKFNPKAVGRQDWILCSYGSRIRTFRNPEKNNEWDNESIEKLTERFKQFFTAHSVDYKQNLLAQILIKNDAPFYRELMALLGLLLQMRNSITNTDTDYIISPVADENGNFYCSNNGNETLPKDADANGAYNIARKGLWAVMQMQKAEDPTKINLAMSNTEWMDFAQQKPYKQ